MNKIRHNLSEHYDIEVEKKGLCKGNAITGAKCSNIARINGYCVIHWHIYSDGKKPKKVVKKIVKLKKDND